MDMPSIAARTFSARCSSAGTFLIWTMTAMASLSHIRLACDYRNRMQAATRATGQTAVCASRDADRRRVRRLVD
jgi:hypothetical protein